MATCFVVLLTQGTIPLRSILPWAEGLLLLQGAEYLIFSLNSYKLRAVTEFYFH